MHSKQSAQALAARCAPGTPWGASDALSEGIREVARTTTLDKFSADNLRVFVEEITPKFFDLSPEWSRAVTTAIRLEYIKYTGGSDKFGKPLYVKGAKA